MANPPHYAADKDDLHFKALRPRYRESYLNYGKELGYLPEIKINMGERTGAPWEGVDGKGKKYFIVPMTGVVWTKELLAKYTLSDDDADIKKRVAQVSPKYQAMISEKAAKHGIKQLKLLLTDELGGTGVFETIQGTQYLELERRHLKDPNLDGMLAHEFGHIVLGHNKMETLVEIYNQPDGGLAKEREREDSADIYSVQHCHGPKMARHMPAHYEMRKTMAQRKGMPLEEYLAKDEHTPPLERRDKIAAAAKKAIELGLCKPEEAALPSAAPATPGPRNNKVESKLPNH